MVLRAKWYDCSSMSDPLVAKKLSFTHRSVAENGFDLVEDEAGLMGAADCVFVAACVRAVDVDVFAEAAARLIAAIAAADAALVWFETFAAQTLTEGDCLDGAELAPPHA